MRGSPTGAVLSLALLTPLLGSCFQPWSATGLYRCGAGGECPTDMACDDGLCCRPDSEPACPTMVPSSGRCADGTPPKTYYRDQDQDSYGNPAVSRLACSRPLMDVWVENMTDCDDGSPAAFPGGTEVCDGRDNNCDGVIDDGQSPLIAYYRDTDGDGYGAMSDSIMACQCTNPCVPPGYAATAGDCAPDDNTRHPGATERCNGLDDDCNAQSDDNVSVGVGAACADAGLGECFQGTTACVGGAVLCRSNHTPSKDLCDGLDNNCNGTADEQPDCGGPNQLLVAGMSLTGARNLGSADQALLAPSTCLKAMGSGETWTPQLGPWSGATDNFHLWWVEAPGSTTWDLSRAGLKLHLQFSGTMLNQNATPWNTSLQPVVLVCNDNPANFSRYRPNASLLTTASFTVNTDMPFAGNATWTLAKGGADLTQVKRIEVMVQPRNNGGLIPSFNITFHDSTGFKP